MSVQESVCVCVCAWIVIFNVTVIYSDGSCHALTVIQPHNGLLVLVYFPSCLSLLCLLFSSNILCYYSDSNVTYLQVSMSLIIKGFIRHDQSAVEYCKNDWNCETFNDKPKCYYTFVHTLKTPILF